MKKIFTMLLVAAGTISVAAAQSYHEKDMAYNDNKKISNDREEHYAFDKDNSVGYRDSYFSYKEKMAKLEMINREFDNKMDDVKFSRRLNGREKARQMQWLQLQKQNEIRKVEYDYAKSSEKNKTYTHHSH